MLSTIKKLWPFGSSSPRSLSAAPSAAMSRLIADLHFEVVPMASIEQAIADLPAGAHVSVTCSPAKGIPATIEVTERLQDAGFDVIPHLAARLVEGPDEAAALADWARSRSLREVFVIAGDAPEPTGVYDGSLAFIADFLAADPGVERIGVAGYPDGHALIADDLLVEQLHAKQSLLAEHGVGGWVSTQMCFDDVQIRGWLTQQRAAGITLPVHLGVPGVVDRARLMKMGTRLGIGASLRFLSKNRSTVMHLMAPGGFDPTDTVAAFADDAAQLGIEAVHSFTFNAVADTRAWQEAVIAGGAE